MSQKLPLGSLNKKGLVSWTTTKSPLPPSHNNVETIPFLEFLTLGLLSHLYISKKLSPYLNTPYLKI
jgi:hypothetical protein